MWLDISCVDGETEQLVQLVENGWSWQWPGWEWVADTLNSEFSNSRTASACRNKYNRIRRDEAHKMADAEFYIEHSQNQYT